LNQFHVRRDLHAYRRRGEVAHVQVNADRARPRGQQRLNGLLGRGFHQQDHGRRGEHRYLTAPDVFGRVLLANSPLLLVFYPALYPHFHVRLLAVPRRRPGPAATVPPPHPLPRRSFRRSSETSATSGETEPPKDASRHT